jgi:hypothetical protein
VNKYSLAVLAVAVVLLAGAGFYVLNQTQTGGSSASMSAVAGDPNYAVHVSAGKTISPFTLGAITASTSSATTTVNISRGLSYGLALGDTCGVQLSSASSTGGFSADAQITAIAAQTSTVTVTFFNGANAPVTVSTGTLKVICQNY